MGGLQVMDSSNSTCRKQRGAGRFKASKAYNERAEVHVHMGFATRSSHLLCDKTRNQLRHRTVEVATICFTCG